MILFNVYFSLLKSVICIYYLSKTNRCPFLNFPKWGERGSSALLLFLMQYNEQPKSIPCFLFLFLRTTKQKHMKSWMPSLKKTWEYFSYSLSRTISINICGSRKPKHLKTILSMHAYECECVCVYDDKEVDHE